MREIGIQVEIFIDMVFGNIVRVELFSNRCCKDGVVLGSYSQKDEDEKQNGFLFLYLNGSIKEI